MKDKELLLIDSCSRLPYGLLIYVNGHDEIADEINPFEGTVNCGFQSFDIEECKPYLRPLSSMTAEEKKYVKNRWCYEDWYDIHDFLNHYQIDAGDVFGFVDWLNENMFDYRGLIARNLAIEVTEENNSYKE